MYWKSFPVEVDKAVAFEEVSLEELLLYGEDAYFVCDSDDGLWQYYFIHASDGKELNVKIKKELVVKYLDEKRDKEQE